MKIAVIGLGYVGLNVALTASNHYEVIGYDNDETKISKLLRGQSYIEGISNENLNKGLALRSFLPTAKTELLSLADVYVICVPTPLDSDRKPDLKYLNSAIELIAKFAVRKSLIINESTSYPGTLRNLIARQIKDKNIFNHLYAVSPERVDPGNLEWDIINTPRILSGLDEESITKAFEFYSVFANDIRIVETPEIAETAKLFENTFRQVNIALVNELAIICDALSINVWEVINAASTKPYGFMKFKPGSGVGGHCIPVDPTYLAYSAEQKGVRARFIELANQVNFNMPKYVLDRCEEMVGKLDKKKILIAGVSYKPNISDVRESPAELMYEDARERGAMVSWHDPLVENWQSNRVDKLGQEMFDLAIIQVRHDAMDIEAIKASAKVVFDCTGTVAGVNSL